MFLIDCSMFPGQDWLRTASGDVALYQTRDEADYVVSLLGGRVVAASVVK